MRESEYFSGSLDQLYRIQHKLLIRTDYGDDDFESLAIEAFKLVHKQGRRTAQRRWGRAARPWYLVAEHSIVVSRLVAQEDAYAGWRSPGFS